MGLTSAMNYSSSALGSFSQNMSVIGNNLANSNTVGFKSNKMSFEDILSHSIGSNKAEGTNQVGGGVGIATISQDFSQGTVMDTNTPTDLSIAGEGFFIVRDAEETMGTGSSSVFYTRAGDFKINTDGYMVTNQGMRVQGVDLYPTASSALSDVAIDLNMNTPANPTSVITANVNLARSAVVPTVPYDPNISNTYNFATSVHVFDSEGIRHNLALQFRRADDTTWNWYAVPAATEGTATPSSATPPDVSYTPGTLSFNPSGDLLTEGSTPVTIRWQNGTRPQDILINFGNTADPLGDASRDYTYNPTTFTYSTNAAHTSPPAGTVPSGSMQTANLVSSTSAVTSNGSPVGVYDHMTVDQAGKVIGHFSNGFDIPLYQIRLASFGSDGGLDTAGQNLYVATQKSGTANVGNAKEGVFGSIRGNSLEQSNVDISKAVIDMIITQRAFQANSKVISTSDEMLEVAANVKR